MKTLLSLTLSLLTFATAAHANHRPGFGPGGDFGRDPGFQQPFASCAALEANASAAQNNLNLATMNLANIYNLCGNNNMMCVVMVQNAYNQAVVGNQQAQAAVQPLRNAQAAVNNAQAAVNNEAVILANIYNLCGNNMACIFAHQNYYNQSLANLQRSQENLRRICY